MPLSSRWRCSPRTTALLSTASTMAVRLEPVATVPGPAATGADPNDDRRHAQAQCERSQKSLSASQQGHWHGGRPHCVRPRLFLRSSQPPRPVRTPASRRWCSSLPGFGSVPPLPGLNLVISKTPSFPEHRNNPQLHYRLPRIFSRRRNTSIPDRGPAPERCARVDAGMTQWPQQYRGPKVSQP